MLVHARSKLGCPSLCIVLCGFLDAWGSLSNVNKGPRTPLDLIQYVSVLFLLVSSQSISYSNLQMAYSLVADFSHSSMPDTNPVAAFSCPKPQYHARIDSLNLAYEPQASLSSQFLITSRELINGSGSSSLIGPIPTVCSLSSTSLCPEFLL